MFKIIRHHNTEIPNLDDCRMAVMAFMENEVLRITVMEDLKQKRFYPMDWYTSKKSPPFLKSRMDELLTKYGPELLRHCFEEWKQENIHLTEDVKDA